MATMAASSCVEQIGEVAGLIWRQLADHGPTTLAKLVKEVDMPKDLVMQAVGWLAREDKLVLEDEGRSRTIALR